MVTPIIGSNCRLAGWGSTSEDGPGSIDLMSINLQIVSNDVCNRNQELNGLVGEGMLCAGSESRSCQGDSGGGLICKEGGIDGMSEINSFEFKNKCILIYFLIVVVAGVVSFGNGGGRPNLQDVYTDVAYHREWVLKALLR